MGPRPRGPVPRRHFCPLLGISPVLTCAPSARGAAPLRDTSPLTQEEVHWPRRPSSVGRWQVNDSVFSLDAPFSPHPEFSLRGC